MRISDCSSDVCSSDLNVFVPPDQRSFETNAFMPTPQSEAFFQKINDGRPVNRRRQSSKKGTIKMIRRFLLLAAVSAAGITAPAWAKSNDKDKDAGWSLQEALGKPEGLTISGSFRVRYEALDNQFRPGLDRKDDLISLRTTLAAEYDAGPLRLWAEVMDSLAYDADRGSSDGNGEGNARELIQAYVGGKRVGCGK